MLPLAQTDLFDFFSKLLALADKDPVVLLSLFLVCMGILGVLRELKNSASSLNAWRKRRKGETPIDPNAKLLSDLAEAIALLTKNQNQNADNTKRLIDRADLLEGVVRDNTDARREYTEALKAQNQLLGTQAQTLQSLLTNFNQAIGDMRGAQSGIVSQVNTHADEIRDGMDSTLRGLTATAEGNAAKLTGLTQKVEAQTTMTEQKLQTLMAQVEKLQDSLKADIQSAFADLQQQLKAKDAEIARLQAALTAAQSTHESPASPADGTPAAPPDQPAEATA